MGTELASHLFFSRWSLWRISGTCMRIIVLLAVRAVQSTITLFVNGTLTLDRFFTAHGTGALTDAGRKKIGGTLVAYSHCVVAQAKHRRIRRWDGLWAVYDASLRWRVLQRRRQQREARFQESLQAAGDQDREALQAALESLQAATTLEVASSPCKVHLLLLQQHTCLE